MKTISKYIEKNANELFVFENPQEIISNYLNQKRLPPDAFTSGENEEWVYFKIQPDDGRELIYNILAYSLLEILDGQFFYGFIETGLAQAVDEFAKICSTDSLIHEQKKVTFMKPTPPFLGREAIYRDILISLKNEEMLIAFLHEFWEDAMAKAEIIVLPVPFEKLDTQAFFQSPETRFLGENGFLPLLYIASYASEYNILVCCKSIHKDHLLERIRKYCEVMEVKFYLQKIGGQNSLCPKG